MNPTHLHRFNRLAMSLVIGCLAFQFGIARAAQTPTTKPALKVYVTPDHVDADFRFQGEYVGDITQTDGSKARLGGQVRALGDGRFRTMFYAGGLPGDGWDGKTIIQKAPSTDSMIPTDSTLDGDKVNIDQVYKGTVDGQSIEGQTDTGIKFHLTRVDRKSPTLGIKPPENAIVLFDGTNTDAFEKGRMTPEKWLYMGATTKQKFTDFSFHCDFMISYVPHTQGIGQRPNSGVYLQQRYEIQILDSFGVVMRAHDCGVLYAQVIPAINMCYPPLTWQTYDIDFTAARWDNSGKKITNARCTVKLNGVLILDNVEIQHSTPGGIPESPIPAGIYLQAHGLPVFFKDVWVVGKK
jgi:hypothetical protein